MSLINPWEHQRPAARVLRRTLTDPGTGAEVSVAFRALGNIESMALAERADAILREHGAYDDPLPKELGAFAPDDAGEEKQAASGAILVATPDGGTLEINPTALRNMLYLEKAFVPETGGERPTWIWFAGIADRLPGIFQGMLVMISELERAERNRLGNAPKAATEAVSEPSPATTKSTPRSPTGRTRSSGRSTKG